MVKKKRYRILMVDDDLLAMQYYLQALELEGYDVDHYRSVEKFKKFLTIENIRQVDLFILDIMMPSGRKYKGKHADKGLYTGLFLAEEIRRLHRTKPIIFLSNIIFPSVAKAASRSEARIANSLVLQKIAYPPLQLVEVVNRYFVEFDLYPKRRRSIFHRIFDVLILQPNISGVGIDLKKLRNDEKSDI